MRMVSGATLWVAAILCTSCAVPGTAPTRASAPPGVVALPNADFEKSPEPHCPLDWGCVAHADPFSFRFSLDETRPGQGKRSVCIEPITKEPWGKVVQAMHDGPWRGRRVRFSMQVRVENVASTWSGMTAGAGVVVIAYGSKLAREEKLIHGTAEWQRLSVELDVPQDTRALEVGVALIGTGKVCADDAVLELL